MNFSARDLKAMAGPRSWERGEDYFERGRVRELFEDRGTILAEVVGTRNYTVSLSVEDGELRGECTCPMGDAGVFCKHCVAVGLAYLEGEADETSSRTGGGRPPKPVATLEDVRDYLAEQDTSALVEIIIEQVKRDDMLRRSLLTKAALARGEGPDIATFREAIDSATFTDGFVDWRSASDFAEGIDAVVDSIAELLEDGQADAVIELAEHALEAVESVMNEVDDSGGHVGGILDRLQELHHAACVAGKPDPEALAQHIFKWQMASDWGTFDGAAESYADVLGEKGLAAYRKLVEDEWAKVPTLGPEKEEAASRHRRYRITSIMTLLARADGDVEALVAVESRDLSSAFRYLAIAELYRKARKRNKALEWAERGLKAFPEKTDPRLREFLAEQYHQRKRHNEAVPLMWDNFTDHPGLEHYQVLKGHAERAHQWPTWRARALAHIREQIAEEKKEAEKSRRVWGRPADNSGLVEILLWEKDVDAAWKEAQDGGCSDALWLQLAGLRGKEHPSDALPIYQAEVERTIEGKSKDAYRAAMGLIRKVQQVMKRLGREDEFATYLASVRAAHKRKRNFMAMLNRLE